MIFLGSLYDLACIAFLLFIYAVFGGEGLAIVVALIVLVTR